MSHLPASFTKNTYTALAPGHEADRPAPLVVHILDRFMVGGLENGLVNLINGTPAWRYRHAVICLTGFNDFRQRLAQKDIPVIALDKHPGQDWGLYGRLWRTLGRLRPDVVHTRNLAALEAQAVAAARGIRARVHGEHGRDVYDLHGANRKYNFLRRGMRHFVHRYTAVSQDLADWLTSTIHVPAERVTQIYNGVDTARFRPGTGTRTALYPAGFLNEQSIVIGTVGRLAEVKDPITLLRAFAHLYHDQSANRTQLRLVLVGDGPLMAHVRKEVDQNEIAAATWLAGERDDVPELMRTFDVFVLPSLGEGTSNTILEAMASGLPVVASKVGGNLELVREGRTGLLVEPEKPALLAEAIAVYARNSEMRSQHGRAARSEIEKKFGLGHMIEQYLAVYDDVLKDSRRA